jgi:electron transfer flavoprotein alpha subunit
VTRSRDAAERLARRGSANGLGVVYALDETITGSAAGMAAALCAAIDERQPQVLLLPATATGAEIAGRVAAGSGSALFSGCADIEWQQNGLSVRREIYGKRAHQVLSPVGPPPWVVSLDVRVLHANDLPDAKPAIEDLAAGTAARDNEAPSETWRLAAHELDVSDADLVLSVGKGVDAEQVLPAVFELAELLDGAVGGSREAVFANMISRDRQVGASGKWIAPRVYVALGISGSSYHLMGIKDAQHVAAINVDANAPFFERAEWVGIADLTRVIPAMVAALEAGRD